MLGAVVISLRHTLDQPGDLDARTIALHVVAAATLVVTSAAVSVRHAGAKATNANVTRTRFELVQPLRRLFSAVWS
jgi:hypothetical protein